LLSPFKVWWSIIFNKTRGFKDEGNVILMLKGCIKILDWKNKLALWVKNGARKERQNTLFLSKHASEEHLVVKIKQS